MVDRVRQGIHFSGPDGLTPQPQPVTRMKTDARYTITREFCGYKKPRYVVRFCGDWIASFGSRRNAVARRNNEIQARRDSFSALSITLS
jgi:hypothetical protein